MSPPRPMYTLLELRALAFDYVLCMGINEDPGPSEARFMELARFIQWVSEKQAELRL